MQTIIKGEKRFIGMKVGRIQSASFEIDTASYDVQDIQTGSCEIDNTKKEVYFLIDTTLEAFQKGNKYLAEFTVTIEDMDKILKGKVLINVV